MSDEQYTIRTVLGTHYERFFWAKVQKTDTCWLWLGTKHSEGYGLFKLGFQPQIRLFAHRLSYEMFKGKIQRDLTIDHLCRVRQCVNPEHLEAVSRGENVLRGIGISAELARKTHCNNGHKLSDRQPGKKRRCKLCAAAWHRANSYRYR